MIASGLVTVVLWATLSAGGAFAQTNEPAVTVALDGTIITAIEGGGIAEATLTVHSTGPIPAPVSVTLNASAESGDTATAGDDFTAGVIIAAIPAGDYSTTRSITVPLVDSDGDSIILDDSTVEAIGTAGAETFTLTLSNADLPGIVDTNNDEVTVRIRDDDSLTVTLTRNNNIEAVAEPSAGGRVNIRFDVALTNIPSTSLSMPMGITNIRLTFVLFDPDDVPIPCSGRSCSNLPNFDDPFPLVNGQVTFDQTTFFEYAYNTNFRFDTTYDTRIIYIILAEGDEQINSYSGNTFIEDGMDNAFTLALSSVVLNNGAITVPSEDVFAPGGRLVTGSSSSYAVQTVYIIDAQRDDPSIRTDPPEPAGGGGEKNNAPATLSLSIDNAPPLGTAMVRFSLAGSAMRGTLAENGVITPADNADYLLTVTDANGEDVAINYDVQPHTFTLPDGAISSAVFTVIPIADTRRESIEDVVISDFTADFSAPVTDITVAVAGRSVPITDYGTLPTATLTVRSEAGDDAVVSEVNADDNLGTFTLELANAPDGTDIATVAYTLAVTGTTPAADDIAAAFGDGANAESTPVVNGDGADTFTMTVTGGGGTAALTVTPVIDEDENGEIVTLTIAGITFADIGTGTNIAGDDIQGDGVLTIVEALGTRFDPLNVDGDDSARERNNVPAASTLLISNADDAGAATVFFSLGGIAFFGTRAEDGTITPADADYLLAITHPDGAGGSTDITADSTITASGGSFRLPPNVRKAAFTVTPVADNVADDNETVLITATSVAFPGDDITTASEEASITIADYNPLPTATLAVRSETGGDTVITEENADDNLGTFTLELANAPDGTDIATVAYTLAVTGTTPAADDIAAAFGDGANAESAPIVNGDGADTFTMTVTGGGGTAALTVTPVIGGDEDENGETVTLTIASITFADIGTGTDIAGGNVQGDGILTINDGVCGRTQEVLDDIVAAAGVPCYEAIGQLTAVTALNLSGQGIAELQTNDFAGLTRLQTLDLSGNSLTELPDGVLDGLGNLLTLNLDGNNLMGLRENVFNDLSQLQELTLNGNTGLTNLPNGVFSRLAALRGLYLNGTGLTSLLDDVFNGLDDLVTLHLQSNPSLDNLPEGVFDDVLDTLGSGTRDDRGLQLDPGFKGTLSFAAATGNIDQRGSADIEVRLDKTLPAAVRVPYTVMFDNSGTAAHFNDLAGGVVDIPAGMMDTTIVVATIETAPIGATVTLMLDTPSLTFGISGESTSTDVVPQLAAVSANDADIRHTLTIIAGVCGRTPKVSAAIAAAAAGVSACEEVNATLLADITALNLASTNITSLMASDFVGMPRLQTLDLSGNDLMNLPDGLFDGLGNLQTLDLSGNNLTGLPDGILDDVLDTLTTLNLGDALTGSIFFTVTRSVIGQDGVKMITVTRTLPYTAVNVSYAAQFGGSPTAATRADFSDFQDDTLMFAAGETTKTIAITATGTAPRGSTATITLLEPPALPADTRAPPAAGIVGSVVRVADAPGNAYILTVVSGVRMRVRVFLEGDLPPVI